MSEEERKAYYAKKYAARKANVGAKRKRNVNTNQEESSLTSGSENTFSDFSDCDEEIFEFSDSENTLSASNSESHNDLLALNDERSLKRFKVLDGR